MYKTDSVLYLLFSLVQWFAFVFVSLFLRFIVSSLLTLCLLFFFSFFHFTLHFSFILVHFSLQLFLPLYLNLSFILPSIHSLFLCPSFFFVPLPLYSLRIISQILQTTVSGTSSRFRLPSSYFKLVSISKPIRCEASPCFTTL
jgi:hypothetical protein